MKPRSSIFILLFLCLVCAEPYELKTPLGIRVQPGDYQPDLDLTDSKYLAIVKCAGIDPDKYKAELIVKITSPDSNEIPWEGKRPPGYTHIWGTYVPQTYTVIVNENQVALAHEIGHYLEHQLKGFGPWVYSHASWALPTKCGNPIDREFNRQQLDASTKVD